MELLLGWVRDGLFGVDMELARAVLAYVHTMWLKPIILTAWTDTSALAQPGYETTNNMLEGNWSHMDRIVFNSQWNTRAFKAVQLIYGSDFKGAPTTQLGLIGMGDKQYEVAREGGPPLGTDNKRRRMNAIAAFLAQLRSSSLAVDNGLGTVVVSKLPSLLLAVSARAEANASVDVTLGPIIRKTRDSVLGVGTSGGGGGVGYRCSVELRFCECYDNLINGPFRKVPCKHLALRGLGKQVTDSPDADATITALKVELASYVKRLEASKPPGHRSESIVKLDPPTIKAAALLDLLAAARARVELPEPGAVVPPLGAFAGHGPAGSVATPEAGGDEAVGSYIAVFAAGVTDLGLTTSLNTDGRIFVSSFTILPSGSIGPAAHEITGVGVEVRALHQIATVNGAAVAGSSGLAVLAAAIANGGSATTLGLSAQSRCGPDAEAAVGSRRVKARVGVKARKVKNTENSSQGRAVQSKRQREVAARVAKGTAKGLLSGAVGGAANGAASGAARGSRSGKAAAASETQTARSLEAELTALLAEIETEAWAAAVEKEYPVTASSGFLK